MINGIEIIDAHMHMFTARTLERKTKAIGLKGESYKKALTVWMDWFTEKYDSDLTDGNTDPPEKIAGDWAAELDRCGVDRALFIALDPDEEELTSFAAAQPERFFAFTTVDPFAPDAPAVLKKRIEDQGYRGLKLYPTTGGYNPSDKKFYPLFETVRELRIPVMLHYGITLSYDADLNWANPVHLHPVLKDFPEVSFIVPHFGAGYFQEVLFLAYHVQNIFLDTSGTNRWIEYLPYTIELKDVFRKALSVFGAERIIFGTDSRVLTRGYREAVLKEQLAILKALDTAEEELSLIMGGNIRRLIRED